MKKQIQFEELVGETITFCKLFENSYGNTRALIVFKDSFLVLEGKRDWSDGADLIEGDLNIKGNADIMLEAGVITQEEYDTEISRRIAEQDKFKRERKKRFQDAELKEFERLKAKYQK